MARPLRIEYDGAFYHVMNRGLEKRKIFRGEKDYEKFLALLTEAHSTFGIICHAFCLLENHYHFFLETPRANLSRAMRHINGVYTQWFNYKYKRVGPLFQGRYKAILVDQDSYSMEISRYIHLNPVKAHLAAKPESYAHSSYGIFLGKREGLSFLETKWLLSQFGKQLGEARKSFHNFTMAGVGDSWDPFEHARAGGCLLGSELFMEEVKKRFLGKEEDREISGVRELREPVSLEAIEGEISSLVADPAMRRKLLIYTLRRGSPLRLSEIAEKVGGVGYAAVSKTVKRLEEARKSDARLNRLLKRLEKSVMSNVKT